MTYPPPGVFRAYDIRGIVADELTPELVYDIGRALGAEARTRGLRRIAVGRDGRLSGPELLEVLSRGLAASGLEVLEVGQVPTPVLYFAAHTLAEGSGVAVTGSHNPPDYNGLKMMLGGETLAGEAIGELHRRIVEGDYTPGNGGVRPVGVDEAYLDRITGDVAGGGLHVVVDCGNGVAGTLAPELLRRLGCRVSELYCEVDGTFPNHHPDPSQPENLQDLITAVRREGADLGMAFDGDGDRLGVVTPSGEIIWSDRLMILYARDVLSRNPGAEIIFDVKCSLNLERAIETAGGRPRMWKTGHSIIKGKMKETGALLAGEMSGHIFFKERWYGFDDGLYAAARLVEILNREDRPATEVFAELPNSANTPELRVELPEGRHGTYMEGLLARGDAFADGRITTLDGLRVDWDEGWGLVRASNTTPCLVVRFEANDTAGLERIQARFREVMQSVDRSVALPF